MKRIEKAREFLSDETLTEEECINQMCPEDILPMKEVRCPKDGCDDEDCKLCWNEEFREEV